MGSLFAALTTAVSGLNAQSSAIGNISQNLANAQTTGYKSVGTEFEQLVNSSNATINNPGGVRATPQYQNDVQGTITSSNTATSLAISGAGYFAVQTATTDSAGNTNFNSQVYYSRQGDFTLDKNGYLVNGSGYYLTGYGITPSGAVNTSTTAPIQISALLNDPVAAKNVNYSANLPANAAIGYTAPASTILVYDSLGGTHDVNYTWTKAASNQWNLDVSIPGGLDANGNAFNSIIPFTFNDGSGGTTAGTIGSVTNYTLPAAAFTVDTTPTTGSFKIGNNSFALSAVTNITAGSQSVSINVNGTATPLTVTLPTAGDTPTHIAQNIAAVVNAMHANSTPYSAATATNSGATVTLSFGVNTPVPVTPNSGGVIGEVNWAANSWGGSLTPDGTIIETPPSIFTPPTSSTTGSAVDLPINVKFGGVSSPAQQLSLNFGNFGGSTGVTQFSNTSATVSVSNFAQDGLPQGSFNSVGIDSNGNVTLNYSNGTTKTINQIPIAQFYAQDQLQQVTGGSYTATLASGNARLSSPGTNGGGTLSGNSLEQSNVDIATQFTNLIQAQQVYTANAKIVTTDSSLLQVTLNMIQ